MEKEYNWKVHFFKKAPVRGILMAAFGLFLMVYLGYFEGSVFLAVLAFILVFVPNVNFFFPIEYNVSEEGIRVSTPFRVKIYGWSELKRYKTVKDAVLLNYPLSRRRVRRDKTIFLFDVPDLNAVEQVIKEHVI